MNKTKIKSFAKINLFLNVGKKINKTNLHDIQSLVCLVNLSDEIKIQKSKNKKDKTSPFQIIAFILCYFINVFWI